MATMNDIFALDADDASKFLLTQAHLGATRCNFQMKQYAFARRPDGNFIINIKRTWDKLLLAARAIAAIENPADVYIIGQRPYAQRGLLKFGAHTGATAIAGRFTPGAFTNQIQKAFKEPRLLIVVDPYQDHQAITEASYVNIPVIAFCNTDSPLKMVDVAIPCNNKGKQSIGLMLWMLAREVLVLKGKVDRNERGSHFKLDNKVIMPDLYFYRDQEEEEPKEEQIDEVVAPQPVQPEWGQETGAGGLPDDIAGMAGVGGAIPSMDELAKQQTQFQSWADEAHTWQQGGQAPTTTGTGQDWGATGAGNW